MYISQTSYIEKVLNFFGMYESKQVSTPLAAHFKFSMQQAPKSNKEKAKMSSIPYSNVMLKCMQ